MPLVSVLMPVYNRESLVGNAIRSVQNQTRPDWELIILDDASTDRTLEICRGFEAEDKRIRVLVNDRNVGCGESRNRLVSHASGEFIAIHDSDDVSVPERFALEAELLKSKPDIGLVSAIAAWIDAENGKVLSNYPPYLLRGNQYPQSTGDTVRLLYTGCHVAITTCMFRRSLLENFREPFGNYRFVDDWYFLLNVSHLSLMWGIPEVLVRMTRGNHHPHLWADRATGFKEARKMKRDVYEKCKNKPDSPINYPEYRRSIAIQMIEESREMGGWKGYSSLLQSFFWDPSSRSLAELSGRARRRGKDLVARALKKGTHSSIGG